MKKRLILMMTAVVIAACDVNTKVKREPKALVGTWKLLSGTLIQKGDTTTTDYTKDRSMIKIINETHFSFLNHDLNQGKDSTGMFVAGGGRYELNEDQYKEFLEYCSDRSWEGQEFVFSVEFNGDTLVQKGVEKVEGAGVDRLNIEKYIRLK